VIAASFVSNAAAYTSCLEGHDHDSHCNRVGASDATGHWTT